MTFFYYMVQIVQPEVDTWGNQGLPHAPSGGPRYVWISYMVKLRIIKCHISKGRAYNIVSMEKLIRTEGQRSVLDPSTSPKRAHQTTTIPQPCNLTLYATQLHMLSYRLKLWAVEGASPLIFVTIGLQIGVEHSTKRGVKRA